MVLGSFAAAPSEAQSLNLYSLTVVVPESSFILSGIQLTTVLVYALPSSAVGRIIVVSVVPSVGLVPLTPLIALSTAGDAR